jgi:CDP-diacylglycerol--glycerol-3-phosphate 3-phosphatidyltransferase
MTWNLPNAITLIRIAVIPVFLFFLLAGTIQGGEVIALVIFTVAALSDAVDGWLARNRNQVTDFGKFADPIADKLLIMAALLVFVSRGEISPIWIVIILTREMLVMGLRIWAMAQDVVISASVLGKLKTLSHIGLVIVLIGNHNWKWGVVGQNVKLAFIVLAVGLAVVSGFEYFYKSRKLFRPVS